jgi:hypothetical protein
MGNWICASLQKPDTTYHLFLPATHHMVLKGGKERGYFRNSQFVSNQDTGVHEASYVKIKL